MPTITPFLWFDDGAEAAVERYTSVFPDAKVHSILRHPDGTAFIVDFEVAGQRVNAMNAGPQFPHTEAFSFSIEVDDQEEADRYWDALIAGGGEESMCGWLKDPWGLSWQITPRRLMQLLESDDREAVERMTQALYQMRRIDIAGLEAAFEGRA